MSLAHHVMLVAANYRPTGMKPVVAKHMKKCFSVSPMEGDLLDGLFEVSIGLFDVSIDRFTPSRVAFAAALLAKSNGNNLPRKILDLGFISKPRILVSH